MCDHEGCLNSVARSFGGRAVIVTGLVVYFSVLAMGVCWLGFDLMEKQRVPVMHPCFADLRAISAGLEASRQGLDPLGQNPSDPWGRPLNYPRIWLALKHTGLSEADASWVGICMAMGFYLSVLMVVTGKISAGEGLVWLAALLSPAVLLGVERGNNDLVIFMMLVAAAAGLGLDRMGLRMPFYGVILLAALLKLFPIGALAAAMRERARTCLAVCAIAGGAFVCYAVITADDIAVMFRNTPYSVTLSYGGAVLLRRVSDALAGRYDVRMAARVLSLSGVILAAAASAVVALRRNGDRPYGFASEKTAALFRSGVGVYVVTFVIGVSFQYRLMFLLLALPQLLAWHREGKGGRIPLLSIVLMMLCLWSLFIFGVWNPFEIAAVLDEIYSWVLFVLLIYLLVSTLPEWCAVHALRAAGRYGVVGSGQPGERCG